MRTYIHYGSDHFDKCLMETVRNADKGDLAIKPKRNTGLWGSPVDDIKSDTENCWQAWCMREGFRVESLSRSFRFQLKNPDKVFMVNSKESFERLKRDYMLCKYTGRFNDVVLQFYADIGFDLHAYIDFEKMIKDGYVAMELSLTEFPEAYYLLYGWDVDSIVVFDQEEVVEVES